MIQPIPPKLLPANHMMVRGNAGVNQTQPVTPTLPGTVPSQEASGAVVAISPEGRQLQEASLLGQSQAKAEVTNLAGEDEAGAAGVGEAEEKDGEKQKPGEAQGTEDLSRSELAEVERLKSRDAEVRAHERAHQSAGGRYTGSAQFSYTEGPDGKRYATGGEVSVNVSKVAGNPEATVRKMQVVKRAALAPAQPSAADRSVYASASRAEQEARTEIRIEKVDEAKEQREASAEETSPLSDESEVSGAEETQAPEAAGPPTEPFGEIVA